MRKIVCLLFFTLLYTSQIFAQSGDTGSSRLFLFALAAVVIALLFAALILVSDNLVRKKPAGAADGTGKKAATKLKQGHDILLEGNIEGNHVHNASVSTYAVQPPNYRGNAPIPKMVVQVGDEVKAGDPLFYDKSDPDLLYVAPVSGEIAAINRGAKRAISEVVILADKDMAYRDFPAFDLNASSREDLVAYLKNSGVWPLLRQRPYDVIADPNVIPKNIFVSTFDTAPLAADMNVVIENRNVAFQKGLDVLNKLTDGAVHLGLDGKKNASPAPVFAQAKGVEMHYFNGPHPAGNVGVQIHHTAAINAGEVVWTVGVQDVITLGTLFLEQHYDASRVIAITGSEVKEPQYVRTYTGANMGDLLKNNLKEGNVRLISGNVLSGKQKTAEQFLDVFDSQITTIKEGDYHEMFGWLLPLAPRPTISSTFPKFAMKNSRYTVDTNTHGEERAFVMTGQYEKMLPMDVYPQHLMKAILINDIDRMEGLGIYELIEEDVALCEFACTSKQPLQQILRKGLDMMREQS